MIAHWGRLYGVSRHDVVQLLTRVGEDCAGAVQLVALDTLDAVLGAPTPKDEGASIEWLSKDDCRGALRPSAH